MSIKDCDNAHISYLELSIGEVDGILPPPELLLGID
jgi:hypothetical protein